MTVTLSTDLATDARDRQEHLRAIVRDTVVPLELAQERSPEAHWGMAIRTDLPSGSVARLAAYPTRVDRTPQLIRESDPEYYQVQMHRRGRSLVTEGEEQVVIAPGDVIVFDPHRPYQALFGYSAPGAAPDSPDEISEVINLMVPRSALNLCGSRDAVAKARLSCSNPMNKLAAAAMAELDKHHVAGDLELVADHVALVSDVLRLGLARQLESMSAVEPEDRDRVLLLCARRFIEENLADPDLNTDTIAAAHHISARKLQRLFRSEGTTVGDHVRGRRLERCRRDLLDAAQRDRSVAAIAFRWGFGSETNFNRRFHAAYGHPPAAYRNLLRRRDTTSAPEDEPKEPDRTRGRR